LERYKITNGKYPENLNQLVPEYIGTLPKDIASAEPYHYRKNAADSFTLWSVGFDGKDNQGTPYTKESPQSGDWVWGKFNKVENGSYK